MKKILQVALAGTITLLALITPVRAQTGMTAVPFLTRNLDLRSLAMGNATVALDNYAGGQHLNPATFGNTNTIQLTSQFNFDKSGNSLGMPILPDVNTDVYQVAPQLIAGFDGYAIGYQYTYLNLGEQIRTDERGNVLGTFRSSEQAHTFSLSYDLNNYMDIGGGLSYVRSKLDPGGITVGNAQTKIANNITLDLGAYGEYPFEYNMFHITPSAGWSLTDFGYPMSYIDDPDQPGDPMPIMMRGGLGLQLTTKQTLIDRHLFSMGMYISRSKLMARRDTDGHVAGPFEALFTSWDSFQRHNGQEFVTVSPGEQLIKQRGFECTFLEILSVRFGRYYQHPQNGNRQYTSLGLGVHYKYITLDYVTIEYDPGYYSASNQDLVQLTCNLPLEIARNWIKH